MKIFISTKNQNKLAELERILVPLGFELCSFLDYTDEFEDIEETGETFEENALLKARAGLEFSGLVSIADDSGLCVDCLGGRPGVYSARYAGEDCSYSDNNKKLLKELSGIQKEERTARFVTTVACVFPDGREFCVRGECPGYIGFEPQGDGGFGYDPIFVTDKGPMATLSSQEKDSISHRGKALRLFAEELKKYL